MEDHGQVKGASYLSTLNFIQERFGPQGRERVLARLPDADRELLTGMLLPIGWYPLPTFGRLLREMDHELGRGDLTLAVERGRWMSEHELKTTHRLLLKLLTPTWIIDKAARLWSNYQDTGHWESSAEGKTGARAALIDHGIVEPAMCATLQGWIHGLLAVAGCKSLKVVQSECRARGGASCVYHATWH